MTEAVMETVEIELPIGDDADQLTASIMAYMDFRVIWNGSMHVAMFPKELEISATALGIYLDNARTGYINRVYTHMIRECAQEEFNGIHGKRATYVQGCKGLLCRRAQRLWQRDNRRRNDIAGQTNRFEVLDLIMAEAAARLDIPGEQRWVMED